MSVATQYAYEPDAPRMRVTAYRAPNAEAPYDDDRPPPPPRVAPELAPWREPPGDSGLRVVPGSDPVSANDDFDPQRTPREQLEDPRPRAAVLTRALLEVLAGSRPPGQLLRWTTPEVFARLEPLVAARRARPWPAAVRRLFVSEPAAGVVEITAVVQRGPRFGALALRLEGLDGRWIVTALQVG